MGTNFEQLKIFPDHQLPFRRVRTYVRPGT